MNHLNQLVSDPPKPEERGDVVEVAQLLVEPRDGVVGQADVGADTVRSEQRRKYEGFKKQQMKVQVGGCWSSLNGKMDFFF